MDPGALWDGTGAAIVLGGTLLATVLGSGWAELRAALAAVARLFAPPFDYQAVRSEIAGCVEDMRHDGVLRGQTCRTSDSEIARVTAALVHSRSLQALLAEHEHCRAERAQQHAAALRPVWLATELAPVFGMAGTLFSLSQMRLEAESNVVLVSSVAMAIVTTLYGLLLANLALSPLARAIERRHAQEEAQRQRLIDWLAERLAGSCPPRDKQGSARARLEQVA
ncbi:MAG: MotA/TolQ/ExbB proton channel family protein [Erythrobacter sp.]|nr:MotA/TolQ/ExbB proton channel family protein [Erythrobacter sp.]